MGEVYRARDTRLDRTVAVKVLASHLSSSPELKQRMEREGRAISSLNHPHICQLYDIGSQNGTDYLVMEFLEGETLAERLRKGAMPPAEVLQDRDCRRRSAGGRASQWYCASRLEAGEHHADPGGAKLMDFGLAKPLGLQTAPTVASGSAPSFTAAATSKRAESVKPADHGRQHRRHDPVHVSGADRRKRSGRAQRYFCVRRSAL